MKTLVISHYTVRDVNAKPWEETWENLVQFAEKMTPRFTSLDIKLKLRKVILDDVTQDTLMSGNLVTFSCDDLDLAETPIEVLLMMTSDFSPCDSCVTPDGVGFACRVLKDFEGNEVFALTEGLFLEASLRVAFKSQESGCDGMSCSSCASGCGDEEIGKSCGGGCSCSCGHKD
ncbi:MAG: DUF2703 domain-containing protein [Synergistaceae bacterium]